MQISPESQICSKTIHRSLSNDNGKVINSYFGGIKSICTDQFFDKSHSTTPICIAHLNWNNIWLKNKTARWPALCWIGLSVIFAWKPLFNATFQLPTNTNEHLFLRFKKYLPYNKFSALRKYIIVLQICNFFLHLSGILNSRRKIRFL